MFTQKIRRGTTSVTSGGICKTVVCGDSIVVWDWISDRDVGNVVKINAIMKAEK